jgi:hypothetical protein
MVCPTPALIECRLGLQVVSRGAVAADKSTLGRLIRDPLFQINRKVI